MDDGRLVAGCAADPASTWEVPEMVADVDVETAGLLARGLGGALEPVIGQVYFAPECHAAYEALGFDGSPTARDGVALPDGVAYFTSRGSLLGQVPGELVASAFAVFNPAAVVPAVAAGWARTDAATIRTARAEGAVAHLERVLGRDPEGLDRVTELLTRAVDSLRLEGRPLAAGVAAGEPVDHPLGPLFHLGDLVREYRGDCHTAAWITEELDAVGIGLLTELYWGLPLRSYTRTRAWSEADFDRAEEQLSARGLITGGAFTDAGRRLRETIEIRTDQQMAPVLSRLGDDAADLIELLTPWGAEIRRVGGYPASGPHDLARSTGAG